MIDAKCDCGATDEGPYADKHSKGCAIFGREWDDVDIANLRRMIPDIDAVMTWNSISQVYFRAGLLACREYMARFVEQGGDVATAQSIRANWWPSLGADPGPPRQVTWDEVAKESPSGHIDHADTPPSIEALARAWVFLVTLGCGLQNDTPPAPLPSETPKGPP